MMLKEGLKITNGFATMTSLKHKVQILETRDDFKFRRNQFFFSFRFSSKYEFRQLGLFIYSNTRSLHCTIDQTVS